MTAPMSIADWLRQSAIDERDRSIHQKAILHYSFCNRSDGSTCARARSRGGSELSSSGRGRWPGLWAGHGSAPLCELKLRAFARRSAWLHFRAPRRPRVRAPAFPKLGARIGGDSTWTGPLAIEKTVSYRCGWTMPVADAQCVDFRRLCTSTIDIDSARDNVLSGQIFESSCYRSSWSPWLRLGLLLVRRGARVDVPGCQRARFRPPSTDWIQSQQRTRSPQLDHSGVH